MGEVAAWNIATQRIEDYLRAHRVVDCAHALQLAVTLIEESRRIHATTPERTPLDVTMDLVTARTEEWFSRLVEGSLPPNPQLAARGRAAWFASDLYEEWPGAFLDPEPPPELLAAARSASLRAGPNLEFSSLIRKEVDYGPMEDLAHETWDQFSWSHVVRAFVIWVCIFFLAYGAYLYFR